MMNKNRTAIAFGGNIGNVADTFKSALIELSANGFEVLSKSSLYTSPPDNCVSGTGDFINCVVTGYWNKNPHTLLNLCQKIELNAGRDKNHSSNESRSLDLDIILFGNNIYNSEKLVIPHPRAHQRFFVLVPLTEIAPDWIFPSFKATVTSLLGSLIPTAPLLHKTIIESKLNISI